MLRAALLVQVSEDRRLLGEQRFVVEFNAQGTPLVRFDQDAKGLGDEHARACAAFAARVLSDATQPQTEVV